MFDDRVFDTILAEMLAEFGADVRTDEESLAYNACCRIALKLEEVYGDMDELNDNLLIDTMDLSHLTEYGYERGIEYKEATYPVALGVFQQEIEIGERFTCGDYIYTVTELIDGYNYTMTCETEGTEANTNVGVLEPVDYIDDYKGGEITEILIKGEDDEDEDKYRARVKASFKTQAFGGNKADYRQNINAIQGVGGCKPRRAYDETYNVEIPIISSDYTIPSSELIDKVQTIIDPLQNSGEGDGLAPFGHAVKIQAVTGVDITITMQITFEEGYSKETVNTAITTAIEGYLSEVRSEWEGKKMDNSYVRPSQIEAIVLQIEGIKNIATTEVNGNTGNLALAWNEVPILKGVDINV